MLTRRMLIPFGVGAIAAALIPGPKLLPWGRAAYMAVKRGVNVTEWTEQGHVVGLNFGGWIVRHNGHNRYDAAKVDEAVRRAKRVAEEYDGTWAYEIISRNTDRWIHV